MDFELILFYLVLIVLDAQTGYKAFTAMFWRYPINTDCDFRLCFIHTLVALCFASAISSITLQLCQEFCAGVNGGESYAFCFLWTSFATQTKKTCYNLCVHNCAAVYDGSCTTDKDFRCCLKTTLAKKQEFKIRDFNKLYNNLQM